MCQIPPQERTWNFSISRVFTETTVTTQLPKWEKKNRTKLESYRIGFFSTLWLFLATWFDKLDQIVQSAAAGIIDDLKRNRTSCWERSSHIRIFMAREWKVVADDGRFAKPTFSFTLLPWPFRFRWPCRSLSIWLGAIFDNFRTPLTVKMKFPSCITRRLLPTNQVSSRSEEKVWTSWGSEKSQSHSTFITLKS